MQAGGPGTVLPLAARQWAALIVNGASSSKDKFAEDASLSAPARGPTALAAATVTGSGRRRTGDDGNLETHRLQ